jgi:hypothetical protein
MRIAARLDVAEPGGTNEPAFGRRRTVTADQRSLRPEARHEDPAHAATSAERERPDGRERPEEAPVVERRGDRPAAAPRPRRVPSTWTEPDVPEEAPSYAVYRPDSADRAAPPGRPAPRIRSEAR